MYRTDEEATNCETSRSIQRQRNLLKEECCSDPGNQVMWQEENINSQRYSCGVESCRVP
jgi:hypothetical protein